MKMSQKQLTTKSEQCRENGEKRMPWAMLIMAFFMVFTLSGCSYSNYVGGTLDFIVEPMTNMWNMAYQFFVVDFSSIPKALGFAIHQQEYINPFLNPNSAMYSVWTYLSEFAWCIVMISIILRFGSWVFFDKTPDWKKVTLTWMLTIFLIVWAPLLGVLYIRMFYGSGSCSAWPQFSSMDTCKAANWQWTGQDLMQSTLRPKPNGLIFALAGFSSWSGSSGTWASDPGTPITAGDYTCLSSLLHAGNWKIDHSQTSGYSDDLASSSVKSSIRSWLFGTPNKNDRIVSGTSGENFMRWKALTYTGRISMSGKDYWPLLNDSALNDVAESDSQTTSLFYGCYAIANKLYQAGGVDARFNDNLDTVTGILKLFSANEALNPHYGGFDTKSSDEAIDGYKKLTSGYYVSLKKRYDYTPAKRVATDNNESFFTAGIVECASTEYATNLCSDIRMIFPNITHPEAIFAPDVSPISFLALLFISFIYIFIYAVYWVFAIWTQFALIVLPILGMLLLVRPQYLTKSFQFMLGPYFLKMVISLLTAILASIVGLDGIVDAGFSAVFILILLCGLTVLALPEVFDFVTQVLNGVQQYISSEQSGYSPDSAIALALSKGKSLLGMEDKKKKSKSWNKNLPKSADMSDISSNGQNTSTSKTTSRKFAKMSSQNGNTNSLANDGVITGADGRNLWDLRKSMELEREEIARSSRFENISADSIAGVGDGTIQTIDTKSGIGSALNGKEGVISAVDTVGMEDPMSKEEIHEKQAVSDMIRSAVHSASGAALGASEAVDDTLSGIEDVTKKTTSSAMDKVRALKQAGNTAWRATKKAYAVSGLRDTINSDQNMVSKTMEGSVKATWYLMKQSANAVGSGVNMIHSASAPSVTGAASVGAMWVASAISSADKGGFKSGVSGVKWTETDSRFQKEGRQGSVEQDKQVRGQDVDAKRMMSNKPAQDSIKVAEEKVKSEEFVEKKREERQAEKAKDEAIIAENAKRMEKVAKDDGITTGEISKGGSVGNSPKVVEKIITPPETTL